MTQFCSIWIKVIESTRKAERENGYLIKIKYMCGKYVDVDVHANVVDMA